MVGWDGHRAQMLCPLKRFMVNNILRVNMLPRIPVPGSVVDPNTLKLDPDTEFWSNLDPDPGLQYVINFEEEKN